MYASGILLNVLDWFTSIADSIAWLFGPLISGAMGVAITLIGATAVIVFVGYVLFGILRRIRVASRRFDYWYASWRESIVRTWQTIKLALVTCKLKKLFLKRRALRRKLNGFSPHKKRKLAKAI